jgi:4-amino-4-deoxy-L-arabinose transferase-like glycosyltransferase
MKKFLVIALFIFIAASFITLPRNPLLNDDAALYALAAKNAVIYNQWLAQFFTPGDLTSFLDKPPLGIWMLAWIPKIVGMNELTVHIPNVLYYCLLLLLLYAVLARLASKRIALYSTLIASTSLALVVYARTPKLDVPLTLFVLAAQLALYRFLKNDDPKNLYLFTIFVALGTLVKSGFGIIVPGLTILGLLISNAYARKKLIKTLFSIHFINCLLVFGALVGGILGLQSFALKDQWLPYLKSITIQSKYNISYLGFGLNQHIIGLLLITIFPWMPLFLSSLKIRLRNKPLNLHTFSLYWFWSNILFLFFFYKQTDFRTLTFLVPPMAILAGFKMYAIYYYKKARTAMVAWSIFYTALFSIILVALAINPQNAQGISLYYALVPIAFFVLSLIALTIYFWKPSAVKLSSAFVLICLSYVILFYNTLPLANTFNDDVKWPALVEKYKQKGYAFYIYRPTDRKLFMSPDLFYVDFISGPADAYFWDGKRLTKKLNSGKAIILSDTESWEKLNLKKGKILAEDSYSRLILR